MASLDSPDLPEPHRRGQRGFVLAPFRGLRFDTAQVGDLGTVISPPYDVLDADTVRELEAANRRNIVRLILSRHFERPYLAVLKRLELWRERGFLMADEQPGLYLYEYGADGITVRGLVGLVGLRDEDERVVLPHEGVMPELGRTDLADVARGADCPSLVVWGELDAHAGNGDALAAALRGERLALAGVGHMPMLEVPFSFRRALDGWL